MLIKLSGILLALLMLAGCQSIVFFSSKLKNKQENINSISEDLTLDERRKKIVQEANRWLGTPYCLGGNEGCVDCSKLTQKVYAAVGITLPRTAEQQSQLGIVVDRHKLRAGDLLFFGYGRKVTHVAIYIGNGVIVHSSSSRGVVREDLDRLTFNFLFARRLIE